MVGKLNILKENQNKTKKQENLTHLWDLKNKIITHLRSWKKKQINKQKQNNSPPKTRLNSHAPWKLKGWHHDLHIFFSNNIMAKLLSYLCWHGNKSENKKNANSIILFFKGRKMPIKKKNQFPKLLTKVKGLTHLNI